MWKWIFAGIAVGVLWAICGPWVGAIVLAIHLRIHPWRHEDAERACNVHGVQLPRARLL